MPRTSVCAHRGCVARPREILAEAARPRPKVPEAHNGAHAPRAHLVQEHVQAAKDVLVVLAGCDLHGGRHAEGFVVGALRRRHHAKVGDPEPFEVVQLATQAGEVASRSGRSEVEAVPISLSWGWHGMGRDGTGRDGMGWDGTGVSGREVDFFSRARSLTNSWRPGNGTARRPPSARYPAS